MKPLQELIQELWKQGQRKGSVMGKMETDYSKIGTRTSAIPATVLFGSAMKTADGTVHLLVALEINDYAVQLSFDAEQATDLKKLLGLIGNAVPDFFLE